MLFEQMRGLPPVACQGGVHDGAVLHALRLPALLAAQLGQEAIPLELIEHERTQAQQPLSPAGRHERLVNVSLLKSGKVKGVRFDTLENICRALDCQPGDILEYRREETSG
jgi:hypothetical protein